DGSIEVSVGAEVKPDTLVGINRQEPPKLMLAPLNKVMGIEFSPEKMKAGLLCAKGDAVSFNQRLFKHMEPSLMGISKSLYYYDSPTSGIIEEINCETGIILIREKLVHAYKPIVLDVASKLGLKPNQIRGYLSKREGDLVYGHEIIGKRVSKQLVNYIRTDATGFITEINTTKGTVTIHYDKKPFELFAHVRGVVTEVEDKKGLTISCEGVEIDGMIGFGPETSGKIIVLNNKKDFKTDDIAGKVVVFVDKVDTEILQTCSERKVSGLIAPSIDNRDWINFYHYEIGVALTGGEKIGFGFIITEGFGNFTMRDELKKLLVKSSGQHGYLSPSTQIRAGVKRPYLIIQ
ncbi:MAG: hypothetical protein JXR56_03935, partial [Candidatus Cloacimonetes bacterium]|nr:hypothetical protein [Candidatus Cloacimonadota bacterium]